MSEKLKFAEVDRVNVYDLMALQVRPEESQVIASNPEWIAESLLFEEARTLGIFESNVAVGLLTVIDPRLAEHKDPDYEMANRTLYVWRLMVDQHHRDKGIGKAAIAYAVRYAKDIKLDGVMLATDESEKYCASLFYEKLGFKRTGRVIDAESEFEFTCK